ncbi:hypothetical protein QR685DRAFT_570000 [Neurospora intermedia]|uniref:DUF8021 domain-containing protein n=1 Tax=Neurospora intermedia TaxID=5142 RepID=A0ABR3DMW7_NEUIN
MPLSLFSWCRFNVLKPETTIDSPYASGIANVDPLLTSSSPEYRENYKQRDINTSVLTTPLKIDYTDTLSIDVVISRPSIEPQFNATRTLAYVGAEDCGNGNFELPYGTPCARLEGSVYYTEKCQFVSLNGETITDRRYLIDEGLRAVSVFSKGGSDGTLLDIHEFRLVQVKLR